MTIMESNTEPLFLESTTKTVQIPVNKDNIFVFPEGIPAFEEYRQFVLYCDTTLQPFFFLKSVGITPEISFVCVDPYLVCPDYRVRLGNADLKTLGLKSEKDAFVFSTVTVRENPEDTTTNLVGPCVVNLKNYTGKQVINEGGKYNVRTRIWDRITELKEEREPESAAV